MKQNNSQHVIWSTGHPVGYVAHDTDPNLGSSESTAPRLAAMKQLAAGMVFAFDGFHSWTLATGEPKTISVEEMVVIIDAGADYLMPQQQELILIHSSRSRSDSTALIMLYCKAASWLPEPVWSARPLVLVSGVCIYAQVCIHAAIRYIVFVWL